MALYSKDWKIKIFKIIFKFKYIFFIYLYSYRIFNNFYTFYGIYTLVLSTISNTECVYKYIYYFIIQFLKQIDIHRVLIFFYLTSS